MRLLHNMSAPPRTSVTLSGSAAAGKTTVVCFVRALAGKVQSAPASTGAAGARSKGASRKPNTGRGWNWGRDGIPGLGHSVPETLPKLSQKLRELFETPAGLFARIGRPTAPAWDADFLIGYRLRYEDLNTADKGSQLRLLNPVFCTDPLLCAGILSRCAGPIFLSRRAPELSWEVLLDLPIAFDDPLATLP